jgi:antirestriction protein ArdC
VFWKFANSTESQEDGEEHTLASSSLLFTRGYSVFNCTQVDGYAPKPDLDTPIEHQIESAEQFFRGINARVAHQGNRALAGSPPKSQSRTTSPMARNYTP